MLFTTRVLLVCWTTAAVVAAATPGPRSEPPVGLLILPGFASTQMYAWRPNTCGVQSTGSGAREAAEQQTYPRAPAAGLAETPPPQQSPGFFQIPTGTRLWVNVAQMLQTPQCWFDCMLLTPEQGDHPTGCVARPAPGVAAVDQLDPGLITGPLSTVWRDFLNRVTAEFAYDHTTLVAAGYDWRLAPSLLDQRDDYFHALKIQIEQLWRTVARRRAAARATRQRGIAIVAHSLGNNILRYFVAWLRRELGHRHADAWFDKHVEYYVGLGAPLLGAAQSLQAILEGATFGLPFSTASSRRLLTTFSSGPWMLPNLPTDHKQDQNNPNNPNNHQNNQNNPNNHQNNQNNHQNNDHQNNQNNHQNNDHQNNHANNHANNQPDAKNNGDARWPFDSVISLSGTDSGFRKIENFGAADMLAMLEFLEQQDAIGGRAYPLYRRYYVDDPLMELGQAWQRPPVRHVFMVYGYNSPTEIHYHFQKPQQGYMDQAPETPWTRLSTTLEDKDTIFLRQRTTGVDKQLSKVPGRRSGDSVVPYASLSKVHDWLFAGNKTETRTSQTFYLRDTPLGQPPHDKTITFVESIDPSGQRTTSVWEIEAALHREIVADSSFIREFMALLRHVSNGDDDAGLLHLFPSKEERRPTSDADCYWDYFGMACALPEFCEYRYRFGDLTLDQSCRLLLGPDLGPAHLLTDDACFWDYSKMQCAYPQYCAYSFRFGDLTLDQSCRLHRSRPLDLDQQSDIQV